MGDKWIKDALKNGREGRVRDYLKRVYGNRAFFKNGKIKMKVLNMAIKRVKVGRGHNKQNLLNALYLARKLKRM